MKLVFIFVAYASLVLFSTSCVTTTSGVATLAEADKLREEGKYDKAILAYKAHVDSRENAYFKSKDNPYFYYLIIGDTYLEKDDADNAEKSYELASSKGVEKKLIADRWLNFARWLKDKKEFERAYMLLLKHRNLDPLLFDGLLDEVSRELVQDEIKRSEG
jgi:tetratricopeptide (TPR) repeat protein